MKRGNKRIRMLWHEWAVMVAVILVLCLSFDPAEAAEKDYQFPWCQQAGGSAEVVLSDRTRIDCLTSEHAIEFDYAKKWAEAIGQSLHYASNTGRTAGIVFIWESGKDNKYIARAKRLVLHYGLPIDICIVGMAGDLMWSKPALSWTHDHSMCQDTKPK